MWQGLFSIKQFTKQIAARDARIAALEAEIGFLKSHAALVENARRATRTSECRLRLNQR